VKSGLRRTLSVLAMCLLLGATLAACGTQSDEAEPTVTRMDVAGAPPTRTATTEGGEPEASPPPDSAQATPGGDGGNAGGAPTAVTVNMVDIAFEPVEVEIAANTDVTITLTNSGALPHTMEVVDQGLAAPEIPGGGTGELVVNLPPGEYDFICPVPGHADAGMVGKLIVTEGGGAAADGGEQAPPADGGEAPADGGEAAPADGGGSAAVTVNMVDLAFEPVEVQIAANTDVTITLTNSGALPHTMEVVDQGLSAPEIPGGGTGELVVNLPPGEYDFICPVPGHADAGMVGKLIVS
jgi:plastocyanin